MNRAFLIEFNLICDYKLYEYHSFDNRKKYYLLGSFTSGFRGFDLFNSDSIPPSYCDKVELSREGRFEFDTLNGGPIIKYYYPTWGTGYINQHFVIGAIENERFHVLYDATLDATSAGPPWTEYPMHVVSKVKFTDVNKDSFLDILEESILDSVADDSSEKTIRKLTKCFLWDHDHSTFVEQDPQKR